ncbi:MAG TPA: FtsX-like permease family protein [Casimicrobiaceae bacterium]|nr:FtsX-like permease family protein [Casimicrobiaceae bacterium]
MIADLQLALRSVVRQPRRSLTSVAAVSFGIAALMLASGFIGWILVEMRESTIRVHLGHIQIVRPGFHDAGKADPNRYLLPAGGAALDAVSAIAGVRDVAPRLSFSGLASHGESTLSFIGEAVDPAHEGELSQSLEIVQGAPLAADDVNGALFGAGLARSLGVVPGDRVVLLVTTPTGGVNALEVSVRGLFSTVTKAYDDSALRLTLDAARGLLRVRGAHTWLVLLDDTRRTDAVVARLSEVLPAKQFQAVPWYALADFYNKTVTLFANQVRVMWVIIAVIIVLSITNTMMMSVMERTWEIGTAMALGDARRVVMRRFLLEGAILGLVGGALGLLAGWLLASWVSAVGIPMPAPPGMAHGYIARILITPSLAAEALALAVVATVAASVYPAWRASRLDIVDALRHNH